MCLEEFHAYKDLRTVEARCDVNSSRMRDMMAGRVTHRVA
jgi:hypothetical protein